MKEQILVKRVALRPTSKYFAPSFQLSASGHCPLNLGYIRNTFNKLVVGNLALLPTLAYRIQAVLRIDRPEGHEQ